MSAQSESSVVPSKEQGRVDLIGGRLWLGLVLLFLIGVGMNQRVNALLDKHFRQGASKPAPTPSWHIGGEATVSVTLITADAERLACAHGTLVQGLHCAYDGDRRPWPAERDAPLDDNGARTIQPYRTADSNALLFIAGLWNQPELALRRHQEPPDRYPVQKLLRFTAYCRVKLVAELQDASLRWDERGSWERNQSALVAQPLGCSLSAPAD
ncbi:MAG: hypothetical protein ABW217_13750 [Polyangiaceae bacterium]